MISLFVIQSWNGEGSWFAGYFERRGRLDVDGLEGGGVGLVGAVDERARLQVVVHAVPRVPKERYVVEEDQLISPAAAAAGSGHHLAARRRLQQRTQAAVHVYRGAEEAVGHSELAAVFRCKHTDVLFNTVSPSWDRKKGLQPTRTGTKSSMAVVFQEDGARRTASTATSSS